jgi:hypothetical protein
MRKTRIEAILVIAVLLSIACISIVFADTGVPAVPEIQGLSTGTGMTVQGAVTETDSGAWTLTNDPSVFYILTGGELQMTPLMVQQLQASGGSMSGNTLIIPSTLLNQGVAGDTGTWARQIALYLQSPGAAETISGGGIHNSVLDPGQVQYTTGYNDQYSGVSGQQTFTKSMAFSTANKIADQSNIKANTNIQYIAIDTGRATRSEDLLLDGAAQAQDSAGLILCPFVNANPGIIPAFCNIEQAGSTFDTTLTSTVTSADTRFVGTDATIPVVLNYNINSEGLTVGSQSSPMIGSVSAYLKVHVQESRNESTISILQPPDDIGPQLISFPDTVHPTKSEDLVYSETSTASGLISKFSKSMSYSSQASAVKAPPTPVPNLAG